MPFSAFLVRFSVEFSIMGYLYGDNWTVSEIISAHFFTAYTVLFFHNVIFVHLEVFQISKGCYKAKNEAQVIKTFHPP